MFHGAAVTGANECKSAHPGTPWPGRGARPGAVPSCGVEEAGLLSGASTGLTPHAHHRPLCGSDFTAGAVPRGSLGNHPEEKPERCRAGDGGRRGHTQPPSWCWVKGQARDTSFNKATARGQHEGKRLVSLPPGASPGRAGRSLWRAPGRGPGRPHRWPVRGPICWPSRPSRASRRAPQVVGCRAGWEVLAPPLQAPRRVLRASPPD